MKQTFTKLLLICLVALGAIKNANAQITVYTGCASSSSYSINSNKDIYTWGKNLNGQLGDGANTDKNIPTQLSSGNWISYSAGTAHTVAIKTDGTLWTWGLNSSGQLGDGTSVSKSVPTQIGSATNWSKVSCGAGHTLAIKTDGTLWAWGANSLGQLGDGTSVAKSVPTQIGSATNWAKVGYAANFSLAIKTDGTLWAWGSGGSGQLGDGTNTNKNIPTPIGSATNWLDVVGGSFHTVAIKTDGTLWAWGFNTSGQVGDGTNTNRITPVQIGAATNWAKIAVGANHSIAIKADGTLWTWGSNSSGQLGDGNMGVNLNLPTQIGTATNWLSIAGGLTHSIASQTDGTVWAWGSNGFGQLGNGTVTASNVPAQTGSIPTGGCVPTASTFTHTACNSYFWAAKNATYTSSNTTDTVKLINVAGCDSVITLNLTINTSTYNAETQTACDTYTWHSTAYTTSGDYTYSYNNGSGCASVDTLHLTINNSTHNAETQIACDTYTWHSTAYTTSGDYTYSYNNGSGCASVDTLHLTINNSTHNAETQIACDTYTWHGTAYTTSGDYTYSYNNGSGCASVDTLHLTINNSTHNAETQTACDSYTWHGTAYTTSGDYTYSYNNGSGCASVDTLHLTINNSSVSAFTASACDSFYWPAKDKWYYASNSTDTIKLSNAVGCDSIVTLNLIIKVPTNSTYTIATCDSFYWSGKNKWYYASNNTDTIHLTNAAGCDSLVTLNLTINTPTASTYTIASCDSFYWSGKNQWYYASNNTDTIHLTNAAGCDSLVTLNLTIDNAIMVTTPMIACDSFVFGGKTYYSSGLYADTTTMPNGCLNIVNLQLTIKNSSSSIFTASACDSFYWPAKNKWYYASNTTDTLLLSNAVGCDSIVTLNLTINTSTASTYTIATCDSFYWSGKNKWYYASNNTDTIHLTNAAGCDSLVTLNLTINTPTSSTYIIASCDSFYWSGKNQWYYASSNTDTIHLTNAAGCDSLVTLNLTINNAIMVTTPMIACDSFVFGGKTYYSSGLYADTTTMPNGCLNIVNLQLTIKNSSSSIFTASACDSFYWPAKNKWYYASNTTDTLWLSNDVGCDSIVTLNLVIKHSNTSTTPANVCNNNLPFTWNGNNYNTAGSYTVHLTNAAGCDSAATLILNVLDTTTTSTVHKTVCNNMLPYSWNGSNYNASGMYMWMGTNSGGCDSIVMLHLTVNDTTTSSETASACGSYTWNGNTYSASGTYTWHGTNAAGCDSMATLHLSILTNIASVDIIGKGAYCGDTVITTLSTNIGSSYGSVSYEWIKLGYNEDTWQIAGHDSTLDINITTPTQYVIKTTIAGCGTFYSNQETVLPVTKPNVSLNPAPAVSICNNNIVNFTASSADSGVNNYAFYQSNSVMQSGASLAYNSPVLTTANNGIVYTVEATNLKPTFDGNITENFWGKPLAVSTFGPSPSFGAGHELNAIYARTDNDNIYIAIAGNVQNNNRIMLFIDSKSGGYNTGNYGRNGINDAIKNFNSGTSFDPGFEADYCLGIGTDVTSSQYYFDLFTLSGTASSGGGPNNYIGSNITPATGYSIGANPVNNSQTQGFEFAIPKSAIGYIGGTLRVFALYSSDNGFLSNQFLTRANTGAGSYGNGIINFGTAKPGPIAITGSNTAGLCKSSVATTVTVKPNPTSAITASACNNMLPYVWAGKNYYTSGSYNDTLVGMGNNGCDSIATLVFTVTDTTTSVTNKTACNNMLPYSWNGNNYSAAGIYTWKGTNAAGCDSIATLVLSIADTTTSVTNKTACNNMLPYSWNGNNYSAAGAYTWKGTNAAGCDSVATLVLSIADTTTSVTNKTVCNNMLPYSWNGSNYSAAGAYTWKGTNASGCDSVATLVLTISDTTTSVTTVTNCDSLLWNGTKYTVSGTYTYYTLNAASCDSTATLHLTITNSTTSTTTTSACDSLWWNGVKYTTSGTYTWSSTNVANCDSTATLHLTINHPTTSFTATSACDSFWWNGKKYTSSGIYNDTIANIAGCDSIITLSLTITQSLAKPVIVIANNTITAGQTGVVYNCSISPNATQYVWSYTGTGASIVLGQFTTQITVDYANNATSGSLQVIAINSLTCYSPKDSMDITITPLPIVLNSFTADKVNKTTLIKWASKTEVNSKLFEVQRSIDGRAYVTIGNVVAKGFASDYSFTDEKPFIGINYYRLKQVDKDGKFEYSAVRTVNFKPETLGFIVSVYPNPVSNVLNVRITNADAKQIRVFDINGKTVYTTTSISSTGTTQIPVGNLSKATYFVEIITTDDRRGVEKFVKE